MGMLKLWVPAQLAVLLELLGLAPVPMYRTPPLPGMEPALLLPTGGMAPLLLDPVGGASLPQATTQPHTSIAKLREFGTCVPRMTSRLARIRNGLKPDDEVGYVLVRHAPLTTCCCLLIRAEGCRRRSSVAALLSVNCRR